MERVLIVDDDPDILRLVSYNVSQAGFEVITASTGREALEVVQKQPPDLIILDVMLPDVDGMEVCRTLRQQDPSRRIPIIMLTARGDEIDRVVGFELGADDYVTKPFSPRELVLRVKSILRRSGGEPSDVLHAGNVDIYPERRQCFVGRSHGSADGEGIRSALRIDEGQRQRSHSRYADGPSLGISRRCHFAHTGHPRPQAARQTW